VHSYKANQPYCTVGASAIIAAGLSALCVYAQSPTELLAQADRLGDRSDWRSAGPLYAKAEAAYRSSGDVRNELYARIGRLHRDLADGSYRTVRAEVVKVLANPLAQNDIPLRIHVLALLEISTSIQTRRCSCRWSQIRSCEESRPEVENRAQENSASLLELTATWTPLCTLFCDRQGRSDCGRGRTSQLRYMAGNGMAIHGMADRSVKIIDQAAELARKSATAAYRCTFHSEDSSLANLPDPQSDRTRAVKRLIAKLYSKRKMNTSRRSNGIAE